MVYQNLAKALSQKNTQIYSFKLKAVKKLSFISTRREIIFVSLHKKYYFYKASGSNWSALTYCPYSQ